MIASVRHDCLERRLVHRGHPRAVVLFREAFKEDLDGNGSHAWLEVKESKLMDAEPVGHVLGIGQRRGQAAESDVVSGLLCNVPHATDDDFDDWSTILAQEMYLIDDDESHV